MSGIFTWQRQGLEARIGPLHLSWDHGGALTVAARDGAPSLRLFVAGRAEGPDGQVRVWDQTFDPRAQFIFVEEGPARLALRVRFRLYDEDGTCHGDGLHEVFAYPDGELWAAFAVSFADQAAHRAITDAALRAEVTGADPGPWPAGGGDLPDGACILPSGAHPLVLPGAGSWAAIGWHEDAGAIWDPRGPADPWVRADRAPYYERWGDLFDQWPGEPGWDPATGAVVERRAGQLLFHWRRDRPPPAPPLEGHRCILRLQAGADADALRAWATRLRQPLMPQVEGGAYRYFHTLDGTYVVRREKGCAETVVRFPADPECRQVRVCLFDLDGTGAVTASVDDRPAVAHTVCLGGRLDDPLGSSPGRVDDHGGPLLTDPDRPPSEVVVGARLSGAAPTAIRVREAPGLSLSYQRWDDRRQLTLTASGAAGSLAQLALRDGVLRRVRLPGAAAWGICQIPLYWFQANALTPAHYVNEPRAFELLENGPAVVRFRYASANRGDRVRSQALVALRLDGDAVHVDVDTRLEVGQRWDLAQIQYLNIFPADTVDPAGWPHDQFVLMDAAGRWMHYRPALPAAEAIRGGEPLWEPRGDLFFAGFCSPRGNLFILVTDLQPAGLVQQYRICVHWLDSHFYVDRLPVPVPAGTVLRCRLQIALAGGAGLDLDEARRIGGRSLAAGRLLLA